MSVLNFYLITTPITLANATLEVNSTGVMIEGLSGGRLTSQALGWRFPVRFRTNASESNFGFCTYLYLC